MLIFLQHSFKNSLEESHDHSHTLHEVIEVPFFRHLVLYCKSQVFWDDWYCTSLSTWSIKFIKGLTSSFFWNISKNELNESAMFILTTIIFTMIPQRDRIHSTTLTLTLSNFLNFLFHLFRVAVGINSISELLYLLQDNFNLFTSAVFNTPNLPYYTVGFYLSISLTCTLLCHTKHYQN